MAPALRISQREPRCTIARNREEHDGTECSIKAVESELSDEKFHVDDPGLSYGRTISRYLLSRFCRKRQFLSRGSLADKIRIAEHTESLTMFRAIELN